ncbi:MAG: hypothetical protein AAFR11_13990 [Pseudomonadota bacterium]
MLRTICIAAALSLAAPVSDASARQLGRILEATNALGQLDQYGVTVGSVTPDLATGELVFRNVAIAPPGENETYEIDVARVRNLSIPGVLAAARGEAAGRTALADRIAINGFRLRFIEEDASGVASAATVVATGLVFDPQASDAGGVETQALDASRLRFEARLAEGDVTASGGAEALAQRDLGGGAASVRADGARFAVVGLKGEDERPIDLSARFAGFSIDRLDRGALETIKTSAGGQPPLIRFGPAAMTGVEVSAGGAVVVSAAELRIDETAQRFLCTDCSQTFEPHAVLFERARWRIDGARIDAAALARLNAAIEGHDEAELAETLRLLKDTGFDVVALDLQSDWSWSSRSGTWTVAMQGDLDGALQLEADLAGDGPALAGLLDAYADGEDAVATLYEATLALGRATIIADDAGVIDRIMKIVASRLGGTAEGWREQAPALLRVATAEAETPVQATVEEAAKWIETGGVLTIYARPPAPVLFRTISAAETPAQSAALVERMRLTARRSEGPVPSAP